MKIDRLLSQLYSFRQNGMKNTEKPFLLFWKQITGALMPESQKKGKLVFEEEEKIMVPIIPFGDVKFMCWRLPLSLFIRKLIIIHFQLRYYNASWPKLWVIHHFNQFSIHFSYSFNILYVLCYVYIDLQFWLMQCPWSQKTK